MIWHDREQKLFPGKLWSLLEMLELNANAFIGAATQVRSLIHRIENVTEKNTHIVGDDLSFIANHLDGFIVEVEKIGARSASIAANRLLQQVLSEVPNLSYSAAQMRIIEIESRFADHLVDIKMFVLNQQETILMQPVDGLLSVAGHPVEGFAQAFPNASFEIEEASKCIALSRSTAAVFHSMRALECGIKAMCVFIGAPDVTKPSEKNWGHILKGIKEKIDEKWPKNTRLKDPMGAKMESLYATLDAVRNPWRNSAMHVETIYVPHEALHILRCSSMFLLELAKHCDEEGRAPSDSPAMVAVEETSSSLSEEPAQ